MTELSKDAQITECGSNDCQNEAEFRMFWPGHAPLAVCEPCRSRARGIANAMGFHLHTERIEDDKAKEAP